MAALTDADKVLRNDTGLAIVSKLEDIADALGGESVIDDTVTSSTKTWSSQLESTIVGGSTYNSSSTYNKGDIVIYNGTLYACKDNSVTGTWNASHWDATTLQTKTDNTLATTDKTVVGAINELNSGKTDFVRVGWGTSIETIISNHSQYLVLVNGTQVYLVWIAGETDINILRFTDMQTFNSTTGTWTDTITNRVFTRSGGSTSHKLTITTLTEASMTIIG